MDNLSVGTSSLQLVDVVTGWSFRSEQELRRAVKSDSLASRVDPAEKREGDAARKEDRDVGVEKKERDVE